MAKMSVFVISVLVSVGCAGAISIDGQLTVIKNDCYERIAIGETLHPSQTYKKFDHNTVNECEKQCTMEKQTCRAYSFGIGPKGNASCLLSKETIRETADLKPIGTVSDTDFDLYIKKLDCQIVLDPPKVTPHKAEGPKHQYEVQEHYAAAQSSYHTVSSSNGQANGDTQHVETLVAIAEGPFAVLHPQHGILVDGGLFGQDLTKPSSLIPVDHGSNYGDPHTTSNLKPIKPLDYGMPQGYDYPIPSRPADYGGLRPLVHGNDYSRPQAPAKPSDYGDPTRPTAKYDYPRPSNNGDLRPLEQGYEYRRPQSRPPNADYVNSRPPPRPTVDYDYQIPPSSAHRPSNEYPRPQSGPPPTDYINSRPPSRPTVEYDYPIPPSSGSRPSNDVGLRPLGHDYDNSRPQSSGTKPSDYPKPPHYGDLIEYGNPRPPGQYSLDRRYHNFAEYHEESHHNHNYYDHYDKPHPNHPNRYGSVIPHPNDYLFMSEITGKPLTSTKACFRRTMAGHRTVRSLVRKLLRCDTLEQCQQECADERRFTCEGFNYRLDPTGRGKGECELLDLPLTRIDVPREVLPDPDCDFYTRDRNAAQVGCRQAPFYEPRPPIENPIDDPRPPRPVIHDSRPVIDDPRPPRPVGWDGGYRPPSSDYGNRRGDSYHSHESHHSQHTVDRYNYRPGIHYLPAKKGYPIIIPLDDNNKPHRYGDNYRYNSKAPHFQIPQLQPPKVPEDWGQYGGSYGQTLEYQGYGHRNYHYWLEDKPSDNAILPAEPRQPIRDECSLRSATGFRLHKGIVKKLIAVPDIYQCEVLCVQEKDFPCASYAFRYALSGGSDNCYLSTRNYKELDYYTDLQPDRDFDIYTMNNRQKCGGLDVQPREDSDCFWRVRSGQRLDHSIVRDSLSVKSIVDCQLECLHSRRFTCRAYSFRYGPPITGGAIDNCQLTDWPFYELDPVKQFVPERDFEVYERGSFGHGCEPDHFGIRGQQPLDHKDDQLCYVGFGSASRILPQAAIKSLLVPTELDCKLECSQARQSAFRCMSFSFITDGPKPGHNCYLSDVMQRDLLPNVDYVHDPHSWLFTWDNFNPQCQVQDKDIWTVYSVSGWPCRRGTKCQENREAGFWYCELEGGSNGAWDYCCSPSHHCGLSNGYAYSWCYVGPNKTQWRKCNDQYYPYINDRIDPPPHTPGYRPDRPNAPSTTTTKPSLNEYEHQFDDQFLSPPKPGGFGQARRWPVAYLHKEMPPNGTATNTKLSAIKSLIEVIKNTEVNDVQYRINGTKDDVLYVKIPLPTFDDVNMTLNEVERTPKVRRGFVTRANRTRSS